MELPKVRVNALALRNLSSLPYLQLRASGGVAPPALAARARWLEHGLGTAQALTAAATAALAESVPSVLVSPVRQTSVPRKDIVQPAVWIFGRLGDIAQACEILGDGFAEVQRGIWSHRSPRVVTDALFDGILRAIFSALEADGALRLGSDIVHPTFQLSYRFKLSLSGGLRPAVVLRIAVYKIDLRYVDDDDTTAVLESNDPSITPVPVVASPLALQATLSKRRLAGDALSASVLARWREAGLLPAGPLKDEAVLFLDLGNGLEVPFPRACVLTSAKKDYCKIEKSGNERGREKAVKTPELLFRSRKRPRSPSAVVEDREEQRHAATSGRIAHPVIASERKKQMKAALSKTEPVLTEIPAFTASSFNAALVEAGRKGLVDAYPVVKHPFARNPARPLPLEHFAAPPKEENKRKVTSGAEADVVGQSGPSTGLLNASEISPVRYNNRSEHAMFGIMDSRADPAGDQSLMPNMDMSDFGALEDDVTKFFGSSFLGLDAIPPSPQVPCKQANPATIAATSKSTATPQKQVGVGPSSVPNPEPVSDAGPSAGTVKTEKKGMGVSGKDIFKKRFNPSAAIVAKVLESFESIPFPNQRPSSADRDKALAAFHEEDVNKKMTDSLIAGLKPSQRCAQGVVCPADSYFRPLYTRFGSVEGVRSLLKSQWNPRYSSNKKLSSLRHMYVPSRRLRAYSKMSKSKRTSVQRSRALLHRISYLDASSDDASDSESDFEMSKVDKSISRYQRNPELEANRAAQELSEEDGEESDAEVKPVNATKVAQAVAVDCASACLVLIEEYQRSTAVVVSPGTRPHSFSSAVTAGSLTSGSTSVAPATALDVDVKSPALTASATPGAIGMSPSNPSLAPSPRITNPSHPSQNAFPRFYASPTTMLTNQRFGQRKERENSAFLAFLSLLQMQSMTVEGLQLFDFNEDACPSSSSQEISEVKSSKDIGNSGNLTYKSIGTMPASSAVLRRVLHGFPRTIECSKALRSYTMDDASGHSSGNLQVDGPLNVSDLYGESTSLQPLGAPQVCVGHNKDWVETSGDVLPLWEKAGLEPYSERKHVEYAVLAPKAAEQNTTVFFRDVSAAYEECAFGGHTAMPFDITTWIANSHSRSSSSRSPLKSSEVSPEESAMLKQYSLSVQGLCNKLKSLSSDRRRTSSVSNIVVYVVSPFARGRDAANAGLLRAVSPLLNSVPGTIGSLGGQSGASMGLPATAWRLPTSHGNILSLHVRVIPHEAVDRKLSAWMKEESRVGVPLRPQLVKALAFCVFSSVRSKVLRTDSGGGKESAGSMNGMALSPDDQMSPMTPDFIAECPAALSIAPHSPLAAATHSSAEDGVSPVNSSLGAPMQGGMTVDQSSALAPSFLHEPAVVLAGVGCQMGDPTGPATMVLHLGYGYCKEASRYVFTWTDKRGELLDSASVPVLRNGTNKTRRSAFWYMWCRGQRWRLPYVEATHVTIAKLGDMVGGEAEDWDVVLSKIFHSGSSLNSKSTDSGDRIRIVQRFPCAQAQKQMDGLECYIDHPTPATPAGTISLSGATAGTPVASSKPDPSTKNQVDHGIRSVSLVCIRNSPQERLLIDVLDLSKKQDFMVVAGAAPQGERYVQGKALLGSVGEAGVNASEIDLVMHYGNSNRVLEKSIARKWDAEMPSDIIRAVAENFHNLRFVGSPPCWPGDRWRSTYPLHIELVRNFRHSLKFALTSHVTRPSLK